MPKLKENQFPAYRLHKQSGQAIVTLSGRDHLLGDHGSTASRAKYDRLIAEWLANGRRASYRNVEGLTVSRVLAEFWAHAKTYYVDRDGQPAKELENLRLALIPLRQLYGATLAADFGPLALQALQRDMVGRGWSRKYINRQIGRVRQVFKWAVSQELVPAMICHGLATVPGLKRGKTEAGDYEAVGPVAEECVQAVLPHVSRQVAAMIRLQLLTGMRPGEVCTMRATDIDTAGSKVWIYAPQHHKTEHHNIKREVRIGPKGQEVIKEFWRPDLTGFLFSPADAERERRAALAKRRKTPLSCGNVPGSNLKRKPDRAPTAHYTSTSYRQAIVRACDIAFPPSERLARQRVKALKGTRLETLAEWRTRLGAKQWAELRKWIIDHRWHPNQLRHTAATRLRREFGIDVAQSILGHRLGSGITEVYAEADAEKLAGIVERVG